MGLLKDVLGAISKHGLLISISRTFKWTGYKAMTWTYFNVEEDPLIIGLDTELMAKLDMARGKAGVPFVITSGKRTVSENEQLKGSAKDSAHILGLAVDLACPDDHMLYSMMLGLIWAGFRRIGLYVAQCSDNPSKFLPRHIHVDLATDKPLDDIWVQIERN